MSKLTAFNQLTASLLLSTATAALFVTPTAASAQTVTPGANTNAGTVVNGVVLTGAGPTFSGATSNTAATPNTSTITLNSNRTILNWGGFNLTAEDTLRFEFAANTGIALNRVGGSATINGQLYGCLGSCNALGAGGTPTNFGGNVWLLSSDGIMIGSTARINAGGLLFGTGAITDSDFFNSNFNFLDAQNRIDVQTGARLTASNGALTLTAPVISFAGNALSSGSIALIGAKDVQIAFDGDMDAYLAVTVNEGSDNSGQDTLQVGSSASFDSAAVASGGRTLLIAASNGTGLGSVVLGGVAADRVEFVEGDVVLYAAGNVTAPRSIVLGGVVQGLGAATGTGDVTIGAANVSAGNLNTIAVDDVIVNDAVAVAGNARLEAGSDLTINTSVTTGGDYTIRADDWVGAAAFNPTEGGDINIEDTAGGLTIGGVTATDDLRITAENGQLTIAGSAITATGGSIFLTTTGANAGAGHNLVLQSNVTDTGSDDVIALTSSGNIGQSGGVVSTASLSASAASGIDLDQANLVGSFTSLQNNGAGDIHVRSNVGGGVLIGDVDAANGDITLASSTSVRLVGGTSDVDAPSGDITINGLSTVSGAVAIAAGGAGEGTVTFNSVVNGAALNTGNLTVTATGGTTFAGAVGGNATLNTLTVNGGANVNGGSVGTGGAQTYNGAVALGANTTVSSSGSGAVTFGGTVDGARALNVNTAGATTFGGDVGATTALASVMTDSPGTNVIASSITTTTGQNYSGSTTLGGDLTSLNADIIVNGALTLGAGVHTITAPDVSFISSVSAALADDVQLRVNGTHAVYGTVTFGGPVLNIDRLAVDSRNLSFASTTNRIGTIALAIDDSAVTLWNQGKLTIGTVDGISGITMSAGPLELISSGGIDFQANVSTPGNLTLSSEGGSITQSAGTGITASNVSAVAGNFEAVIGNVLLTGSNDINSVDGYAYGNFTLNNSGALLLNSVTGATGVSIATSGDMTVNAPINNTHVGNLSLTAGGNMAINEHISAEHFYTGPGNVSLTAGGVMSGTAGKTIVANDIALTADDWTNGILGAAALQESNNVSITDTAGGLTISSLTGVSAANGLSIETTAGSLSVGGVSAGGDISLTSAGNLALTGAVDASGDTLTLNAAGDITQTAAFSAGTLTGSAGGSAELTLGTNQIGALWEFTAERLRVADSGGLSVTGAVDGGNQEVTITTSGDLLVNAGISSATYVVLTAAGSGADIMLNDAVSANSEVGLMAGGSIGQGAAGTITTNNLYASATGSVSLTAAANNADNLLSSGGNGFAFADAGGLAVTGTVNGGAGAVSIATTGDLRVDAAISSTNGLVSLTANGAGSDLGIYAALNAGTGAVHLLAGGSIGQSAAGTLTGGTLTGSAGGTVLLGAANQIAALGNLSGSSIVVADAAGLTVTGAVNAGAGDATIRTSGGDLTMASTGNVTGAEIVLSTDQDFINQSGADAVTASDRWLVYSTAPDTSTYGGLDSDNTAIWNATFATAAPATISGGNRYVFAYQPTLTFASADASKTYGSLLTTSGYTVSGFHPGVAGAFLADTAANAFSGAPALNSAGYAAGATVAGGPYAIGIAAGTVSSSSGYALAFNGGGLLTVDPKAVTGSVTANDKTYDGTTDATGSVTLSGVLFGDDVTAAALLAFADQNAGSDKTVLISGGSLSGADAGNYTLSLPASVLADIFRKAITGSVVADDKTYDGTADAAGSITLDGVIAGDEVTASAILAFANANAGNDKTVTVSGGSLSGADSGNYTLSLPASVLADIFQKAITGTVVADDKTYDGTAGATGSIALDGVIAGDDVTASAILAFADANAGNDKVVTVSGGSLSGADAGNYTLSLPASVLADIFQKAITGTVVADDKTYDGTTDATGTITLDGVIAGDEVMASAILAFADANAGSDRTVTVSGGALSGSDSGNYTLTLPASVVADIFRKALTGTVVANDKTYDGTTGATGWVSLSGVIAGDEVTASALLTFADKNAGSDKLVLVSGGSLAGADAGNYTLSLPASVLADIFRLAITGTLVANDKTYDGTTGATGAVSLSGVLAGDEVTAAAILAFADSNAGNDKTVTISEATLSGADAGNYAVSLPASTLANIFRAAITVTADSLSKGQGMPDPALTYALTTGQLFGTDTLSGALARASGELPGDYAIGQGTLSASSNYDLAFVSGTFTVEPRVAFSDDFRSLLDWRTVLDLGSNGPLLVVDERDCDEDPNLIEQCGTSGSD